MIALVFDTETTGIPKHPDAKMSVQPKVIEFAGVLINEKYEIIDELEFLCNPGEPLEAIITKITGLTDADLEQEPPFAAHLPTMTDFFRRADALIAHNLPFDQYIIQLELDRAEVEDFPWPLINLCTVQEHAEEWGRRPKLIELYKACLGKTLDQTHRALDDVKALVEVCAKQEVLNVAATARQK